MDIRWDPRWQNLKCNVLYYEDCDAFDVYGNVVSSILEVIHAGTIRRRTYIRIDIHT